MTSLAFEIFARDHASQVFDKIGGKATGTSKKLLAFGATAGAGVTAAAKTLYDIGSAFDDAFDAIRIGTGATGATLAGLQNDFRAVAKEVPADFGTIGQVMADLNQRTGATGTKLQGLSVQILNLAHITGEDASTSVAKVTRLFGDWSIKTKDQSKTLDELYRASQATGVGVNDLASTVVEFGAPLRQLGFNFETSIGLLAKWEKEGVNTSTVLSGLKQGLGNFAKAGKDPQKALMDITAQIKNAGTASKANGIAIKAFGKRAGPDMAAAIREGRFSLGDLFNTIKNGKDTINSGAKDTEDFAEKWQKLKNNAFIALEPIATKVFNLMSKLADKLAAATPFIKQHATAITVLVGVLGTLVAIVILLSLALKAWAVVQAVLDAELWANPIGLIVLAIIALIAIIVIIATKTTWFQTIWKYTWGAIKAVAVAVWHALVAAFHGIVGAISTGVSAIGRFGSAVKSKVASAIATVRSVPGKIKAAFSGAGSWLWNAGAAIINGLINGVRSAIGRLRSLLSSVTSWIPSWKGPPEKDAKLLVPAGQAIMGGLIGGISGELPALKSTLGGVTNTIAVGGNAGAVAVAAGARGAGGGGTLRVEWVGGNGGDEFMKWLRKNIRIVGGGGPNSVQKALGG